MPCHAESHREATGSVRRQREGKRWAGTMGSLQKGTGEAEQAGLGLTSVTYFRLFQQAVRHRDCPGCLVLGSGGIREGEVWPGV